MAVFPLWGLNVVVDIVHYLIYVLCVMLSMQMSFYKCGKQQLKT